MTSLLLALTLLCTFIVLSEIVLWRIFANKVAPISFPPEADTSFFRFFRMRRLRLVAIVHTLFLVLTMALYFIFVW